MPENPFGHFNRLSIGNGCAVHRRLDRHFKGRPQHGDHQHREGDIEQHDRNQASEIAILKPG